MLDVKILREDFETVKEMLAARKSDLDLSSFDHLDLSRRELISESDRLKQERNATSKEIGLLIR